MSAKGDLRRAISAYITSGEATKSDARALAARLSPQHPVMKGETWRAVGTGYEFTIAAVSHEVTLDDGRDINVDTLLRRYERVDKP